MSEVQNCALEAFGQPVFKFAIFSFLKRPIKGGSSKVYQLELPETAEQTNMKNTILLEALELLGFTGFF